MSKKSRGKQKYPRRNSIQSSKKITLPRDWTMRISYENGQLIIADKDGIPYDTGSHSMVRTYQGEAKERVVAKATNLDFVTDHIGSWPENFDFIFAMDTNTHTEKCGDFFCSAAAIYYADIEKVNALLTRSSTTLANTTVLPVPVGSTRSVFRCPTLHSDKTASFAWI